MTKPMSDGGKGSVRRNENSSAYRDNWESIFGKAKKETQEDIDSLEQRLKEQALEKKAENARELGLDY